MSYTLNLAPKHVRLGTVVSSKKDGTKARVIAIREEENNKVISLRVEGTFYEFEVPSMRKLVRKYNWEPNHGRGR